MFTLAALMDRIMQRPPRSPLPLALFFVTIFGMLFWAGCQSPRSQIEAQSIIHQRYSPLEEEVIVEAIRHWFGHNRNLSLAYRLDPSDRRLTNRVRRGLADLLPPEASTYLPEDIRFSDNHQVFVDSAVLPEGNFAYVTLRAGNRFEIEKYAKIFERTGTHWTLLDSYLIANTHIAVALTDFNWDRYKEHRLSSRQELELADLPASN